MVDEADELGLGVFLVDFERPDPRCVINGSILETPHILAIIPLEGQELNINLYLMARQLFVVTFGMQLTHPRTSWKGDLGHCAAEFGKYQHQNFEAVIAYQIPNNPDRTHVIFATKIEYFLDDLGRCEVPLDL